MSTVTHETKMLTDPAYRKRMYEAALAVLAKWIKEMSK